ncbi:PfkB family carbohydrate kinase [Phytobacter massiliensis]|uniref:PfkB family carbohydrate kinase n=1 Tax=Phytobacter massiliensis TaxID=1485952 RepID=UPI0002E27E37|nr:PfkB family carbohydrate kinase [Phytobacter massiliensis]
MTIVKPSCLLACEILWDCVEGQAPLHGGATLNVAYHLNKLGCRTIPVSSVGNDELGRESLRIIKEEWQCDPSEIAMLDNVGTGIVDVKIDANGDANYFIHTPAAWDYISFRTGATRLACDAFVFGSVALRSAFNQHSFDDFLTKFHGLKCFDVNLREGQNDIHIVCQFLKKADFIKLNEDEMDKIATFHGIKSQDKEEQLLSLIKITGEKTLCLTCGDKPPLLYWKGKIYKGQSIPVKVKNTIGAGDAFFASMIHALISSDFKPDISLYRASTLGSWVATKDGAQPEYDAFIIEKLGIHKEM